MRPILALTLVLGLAGCGVAYISPSVTEGVTAGATVRVVPMTAETTLAANRSDYAPKTIPAAFYQTAGTTGPRTLGALPTAVTEAERRPMMLETRLPPEVKNTPYRIGTGDVLRISMKAERTETGVADPDRQTYTVQDDGAIAIPDVGRVRLSGLTIEAAESAIFQALVENRIDPSFSLEISEYNSRKVSIGGAVSNPGLLRLDASALFLDQALQKAGGVTAGDTEYTSVRLYRDGRLYQIPLDELYSERRLQNIRLLDGDSIFVDNEFNLARAQAYFQEQIELKRLQQSARSAALNELQTEISLQRAAIQDRQSNFKEQAQLGAVDRDYVFLTGEVKNQTRFVMPFARKSYLADALFAAEGFNTRTANPNEIYVLRGSPDPLEFAGITAYQLKSSNAAAMVLATRFELRPNDVIFIAEQPVTRWNRVISQITPQIVTLGVDQAQ